jgi:23S rRNA (guanosine2251-2'-O)-methyltransferase
MPRRKPFRDREAPPRSATRETRRETSREAHRDGKIWLYGAHTVRAALANPERVHRRLLATPEAARTLAEAPIPAEVVARAELEAHLPADAVHQGVALLSDPLPEVGVEDLVFRAEARAVAVVLDQVTDPQNVGAVLRAAAAFGAIGVVVHERHAPPVTGALAKAASGALETVPLVRAVNIARALEAFKEGGFWCAGLAEDAPTALADADFAPRTVLVLGAEGEGLRRLTRETCDLLVRIPTAGRLASLNVAAAAAVALYELAREPSPR